MHEQPLIINLAPTGMVPTQKMNRHVPVTPKEIIADVLAAAETGIAIAHLHARDERGEPTTDKEIFARIIGGFESGGRIWCSAPAPRGETALVERAHALAAAIGRPVMRPKTCRAILALPGCDAGDAPMPAVA
jgi:uncharacterized protein (DUF849 family)